MTRNNFIGDDFERGCIVIQQVLQTGEHTHNGEKVILIAKFNIFPKKGVEYNKCFIAMTTKRKLNN